MTVAGISSEFLLAAAFAYAATLFIIAFWADLKARAGRLRWLDSPYVYTLSLSVYCTSWTFFGAVGTAARSGLEFATIYLGPTLVFVGWWIFLRKLVRVGREQQITSIADFLSSRYGKSPAVAAIAAIAAVVVTLPYIALQLQAVATSVYLLTAETPIGQAELDSASAQEAILRSAFWLAAGLAAFTLLFGTRTAAANERHPGVVAAIALEACVKLFALLAVGVFAVWSVGGGLGPVLETAPPELLHSANVFDARWAALTALSAAAIICLPRQFQVTVVECSDERHGAVASWAFPFYLLLMSLFVLPIALVGLQHMPSGADPDFYVLTLPLQFGESGLALLAFLGGFSSATSMVVVSCIALSTMVSNHLVMPLALNRPGAALAGDYQRFLLTARRAAIVGVTGLGFLYFALSGGGDALAAIGLISFAGVAQLMPSLIAGLFWRRANARGAIAGLSAGFALWAVLLFIPSLSGDFDAAARAAAASLSGPALLENRALFGLESFDPLVNTLFWSLSANSFLLVVVSLSRDPTPLEQLQGAQFLEPFGTRGQDPAALIKRSAAASDLFVLAQRILGADAALKLFETAGRSQGRSGGMPEPDAAFITLLERQLAGSVGAASSHALVSRLVTGGRLSLAELMDIADENARTRAALDALERASADLADTAHQLRLANARLQELDAQKDDFLSQVSHELRTPMTSLRAFVEILLSEPDLPAARREAFLSIIHREAERLTRLLDQILDKSQLDHGGLRLDPKPLDVEPIIDQAAASSRALAKDRHLTLTRNRGAERRALADADRLQQVIMNLIANAIKYNDKSEPRIWIETFDDGAEVVIRVSDNGPGIAPEDADRVFSPFARASSTTEAQGYGLGLAICRQIMDGLGGSIRLTSAKTAGAAFDVRLRAADAPPEKTGAQ